MTGPTTKVCRRCRVAKPFADFHKNRSERDGHAHYCKACKIEYNRLNKSRRLRLAAEYLERSNNASS